MPGLLDVHVHLNAFADAAGVAHHGATSARSASSLFYQDVGIRALCPLGTWPGARAAARGSVRHPPGTGRQHPRRPQTGTAGHAARRCALTRGVGLPHPREPLPGTSKSSRRARTPTPGCPSKIFVVRPVAVEPASLEWRSRITSPEEPEPRAVALVRRGRVATSALGCA